MLKKTTRVRKRNKITEEKKDAKQGDTVSVKILESEIHSDVYVEESPQSTHDLLTELKEAKYIENNDINQNPQDDAHIHNPTDAKNKNDNVVLNVFVGMVFNFLFTIFTFVCGSVLSGILDIQPVLDMLKWFGIPTGVTQSIFSVVILVSINHLITARYYGLIDKGTSASIISNIILTYIPIFNKSDMPKSQLKEGDQSSLIIRLVILTLTSSLLILAFIFLLKRIIQYDYCSALNGENMLLLVGIMLSILNLGLTSYVYKKLY